METNLQPQTRWYNKKSVLILLLFILPPVGIYGIWKRKRTKDWKKAIYTFLALFSSVLLLVLVINLFADLNKMYYDNGISEMKKGNYTEAIENFGKVENDAEQYQESMRNISEIENRLLKTEEVKQIKNAEKIKKLADFQKKWADSILKSESQVGNRHIVNRVLNSPFSITFEYTESITKNGFSENLKVDTAIYSGFYKEALRRTYGSEFDGQKTEILFIPNRNVDYEKIVQENTSKAERKNKIAMQFSSWDGSHSALKRMVKEAMHDPSSFDHVETTYREKGKYILVNMTYRGKNAFGAKVLNTVSAKVDENGNVISVQ